MRVFVRLPVFVGCTVCILSPKPCAFPLAIPRRVFFFFFVLCVCVGMPVACEYVGMPVACEFDSWLVFCHPIAVTYCVTTALLRIVVVARTFRRKTMKPHVILILRRPC